MIETACDVVLGSFILLYEVLKETGENRDRLCPTTVLIFRRTMVKGSK